MEGSRMTLIYSDGYFRTGSNFLHHSLKIAYPNAVVTSDDPAPHFGVGLIKDLTIYSGIAISLRDPVDTLCSIFSFFKIENNLEQKNQHVKYVKTYLEDIKINKENIFISKFDEMSADINSVLNKFYQKFPQLGEPLQVNDLDVTNSLISSGRTHAVPGFNTEDNTELHSQITTEFAADLEQIYLIYNEIIA
jgi:hypothetical protein